MDIKDIVSEKRYCELFADGKNKILRALLESEEFKEHYIVHYNNLLRNLYLNLYQFLQSVINTSNSNIQIEGFDIYSEDYEFDRLEGICDDLDPNSVRYINKKTNKAYKMKTSKFIHKVLEGYHLPETVVHWLGETINEKRKARLINNSGEIVLKYGNTLEDFYKIYKEGPTDSCMKDGTHISFYKNNCDCKACWIENLNGIVLARCIVFNKVYDLKGNEYRLAERQYSNKEYLKEILILKLINEGLIDGYKKVGASSGCRTNFVKNDGTPLNQILYIDCDLCDGDIISYQDSFVYYDFNKKVAYNNTPSYVSLNTTVQRINMPYCNEKCFIHFVYLPTYNKRVPVSYHSKNSEAFSFEGKLYIGNYEIIDSIKVPKESIVCQYTLNNVLVAEYVSYSEAAKQLNIKAKLSILNCLEKRTKTSYKYKWKYKYEN